MTKRERKAPMLLFVVALVVAAAELGPHLSAQESRDGPLDELLPQPAASPPSQKEAATTQAAEEAQPTQKPEEAPKSATTAVAQPQTSTTDTPAAGAPPRMPPNRSIEEIIVTARKQAESLQETPVAVTAISGEDLKRYGLTQLQGIADMTPQLFVTEGQGGEQGTITLRGMGSPPYGGFEQAVSIYLDGVQYSRADVISQGYFDLGQVEILKGPQALLFGKNNTAGVISITSADPGDELELVGRSGYESRADEYWMEAIGSTPITHELGARLAIRFNHLDGFVDNGAAPAFDIASLDTAPAPKNRRWPDKSEFLGRLTLAYRPTEALDIKLKLSGVNLNSAGMSQRFEMISCAAGHAFFDLGENCRRDWKVRQNDVPPAIARGEPAYDDERGALFARYHSYSIAVPVNYQFDWGTLSSITGYYDYAAKNLGDYDFTGTSFFYLFQGTENKTISQEMRLLTKFDFPVNFMFGGYYQHVNYDLLAIGRSLPLPVDPLTGRHASFEFRYDMPDETFSGFGQLLWDVTETVELAGGVRYTREEKSVLNVNDYVHPVAALLFNPVGQRVEGNFDDDNFSPEVTLSWRPHWLEGLMTYAAYKQGYKSGGFAGSLPAAGLTANDMLFKSEKVEGFEGGVKSTWLENTLRLNVVGYRYDYEDLQVFFFDASTLSNVVQNAKGATTTGTELELLWLPPIVDGLRLEGSLSYNVARYDDFLSFCWGGQTLAEGCNLDASGASAPLMGSRQQLEGKIRPIAPQWTFGGGFQYQRPVAYGVLSSLDAHVSWNDRYNISAFNRPDVVQDSFFRTDAGLSLFTEGEWLEFRVFGRNLSNQYYTSGVTTEAPLTSLISGSVVGIRADQVAPVNRPREVAVQLTLRF